MRRYHRRYLSMRNYLDKTSYLLLVYQKMCIIYSLFNLINAFYAPSLDQQLQPLRKHVKKVQGKSFSFLRLL